MSRPAWDLVCSLFLTFLVADDSWSGHALDDVEQPGFCVNVLAVRVGTEHYSGSIIHLSLYSFVENDFCKYPVTVMKAQISISLKPFDLSAQNGDLF